MSRAHVLPLVALGLALAACASGSSAPSTPPDPAPAPVTAPDGDADSTDSENAEAQASAESITEPATDVIEIEIADLGPPPTITAAPNRPAMPSMMSDIVMGPSR